jgi:PAS domain S-box-containing protein
MEAEERRKVLEVAKAVSATLGANFFRSLVKHLVASLPVDGVYVAELTGEPFHRLVTIAVGNKGGLAANLELAQPGSASAQVLADGSVALSVASRRIFPADALLEDAGAEGYVGVRLCDSAGQIIGLIGAFSNLPMEDRPLVKAVLETFVPRAAAELERKRSDDALRESEERYRAFIASNPDAMWRIEFERPIPLNFDEEDQIDWMFRYGYVAECNEAMSRLAGAGSTDELVGRRLADIFGENDRIREELRSAARSGYSTATIETTPLDRDGRTLYRLRTQCGIVENNELRRIWGTTRDITDLRRAEGAVQASERRFREVLENIQLPALMLDSDGRITFCNDHLLELMHASRPEIGGKSWIEMIDSPSEHGTWAELLSGRSNLPASQFHFQSEIRRPDSTRRLIVWDTTILRNELGAPAGLAAIGKDITDQKVLEARVLQAERFESIGRLSGGVAHDFNSFLTVIIGQLLIVLDGLDPGDPIYKALSMAASAAGQCATLTEELLAIGGRQRLRPESINWNGLIRADYSIIRSLIGEGIELTNQLDPSLGFVYADASQARRVLTNLVSNASDAMLKGGRLTIATSNVDLAAPLVTYPSDVPAGSYVRLSITDTGIGLSKEVKERMFEPFFTTKPVGRGTGLGLSTVYGVVTQSGGYISVRDNPGGGTIFEILMPRREEPGADKKSKAKAVD